MEYEELVKNEDISWRQKSRTLWLKEGDMNTKFFHKMANAHKSTCVQKRMNEDLPVILKDALSSQRKTGGFYKT
ncbi:hypothetical protein MTR67_026846, partial [Solanum verrucosum]